MRFLKKKAGFGLLEPPESRKTEHSCFSVLLLKKGFKKLLCTEGRNLLITLRAEIGAF